MKIQYQSRRFYPDLYGGAEVIGYEVVRRWREWGIDVSVATENYGKTELIYDEPIDGVCCTRIPTGGLGVFWRISPLAKVGRWYWHQKNIEPRADVIFASNPECIVASKLAYPTRPAIYRCEGITKYFLPILGRKYSLLFGVIEKLAIRWADAITVPTKIVKSQLTNYVKVNEEKIHVIPYGVEFNRFANSEPNRDILEYKEKGEFIIVSVGRLTQEKGMDFLIDAFSRMKNRDRSRLVILGDGFERDKLADFARSKGLNGRVIFTGKVDNPESYLKSANVHVLASRYETFGIVHLEAMACGLPTITWRSKFPEPLIGASEIIIDGKTGFCIEPYNVDSLAGKLDSLIYDGKKVEEMGASAQEYVKKHFSWDRTAKEYLKVIERVL